MAAVENPPEPARRLSWPFCLILLAIGSVVLVTLRAAVKEVNANKRQIETKGLTLQLVAALKHYKQEYGSCPAGNAAQMMETLRRVRFFEARAADCNEHGELTDPWKMPFRFDATDAGFAWAYSCGPNKLDEGGAEGSDDLVSWR